MLDLRAIPIIEHHGHALARKAPDQAVDYLRPFSESDDPVQLASHVSHTAFFRWALHRLADFFHCRPEIEAILQARATYDPAELSRRFFAEARIEALLLDYGYRSDHNLSLEEMRAAVGCRVEPILRLETLAERLIIQHARLADFREAFATTVERARTDGHVALKSIIAYRSGLEIKPPSQEEVEHGFQRLRARAERGEPIRLADKPLCDELVLLALQIAQRQELPIQFHTGFGDRDLDLRWASPLHLRWILESGRYRDVPIVLLHAGYPYVRDTAYLASIYPNVFVDVSLAIPLAGPDIVSVLTEIFGLAPYSKVMFSSDAHTLPEMYWLAAELGRRELARALAHLMEASWLTRAEAEEVAHRVLHDNAAQLYGL
ncbi:MAG: amidohydrolase family protein [Anaerolineae bacterium]|nr:amidohydrolase family protein [Anaerolineae bacterium]MDW8098751.1 amidohydrolase family protein [Anaerolineae bacterium]